MSKELAIHGGTPVRTKPFPPRPRFGPAEYGGICDVWSSGTLSGFLAEPGDAFYGGPHVRALEAAWCEHFGVAHAVSMNSGTSCLFAAVRAFGIGPGDEVIVTPWSMSASATCVLAAGATPVFADIEPETYGLDPESVRQRITDRTKAIVVVDLFGCPIRWLELACLADDQGIPIIEDAAQAIGATFGNHLAGTLGDIGVFSLNRHKTIQCGEGGVAITDSPLLADKLRLIRNHGEVKGGTIFGGNYRMGEIEAAIAKVQLSRLEELTAPRIRNAERISAALAELEDVFPPIVPEGLRHVYYLHAVRLTKAYAPWFLDALQVEGIPVQCYVEPLYHLPVFQGSRHSCPEAKRAHREVLVHSLVHAGMTDEDIDDIITAFQKVHEYRETL